MIKLKTSNIFVITRVQYCKCDSNNMMFCFYDDSDRRIMSSIRTLVTLLRPWIRRFTIIISAWWLRTSSKFTWEKVKTFTGKLEKWSTPKRVRIRPKHCAPSLSRDRRIKMHQSIKSIIWIVVHIFI